MSVAFRQDIFGGSSVVFVEAAFGADLTADPATWTWTDVTADVMYGAALNGTWGRADETSQSTPAGMTFSLLNESGDYSAYVAGIGFNSKATPIRVRRNLGAGAVVEFQGRSVGFTPTWDTTGKLPIVKVVAAGRLRQLGQPKTPVRSALRYTITTTSPISYWPLEDGVSTDVVEQVVPGGPVLIKKGTVNFASSDGPGGSGPVADLSTGGQLNAYLPTITSSSYRIEFVCKFPSITLGDFVAIMDWVTPTGGIDVWEIDATDVADGGLYVQWVGGGGTTFGGPYLSNVQVDDGEWHHIRIDMSNSGGDHKIVVTLDGTAVITETTPAAWGVANFISVNPTAEVNSEIPRLGHLAVWAPWSGSADTAAAATGYLGELAHTRLARVADEQNTTMTITGTSTTALGPQPVDTPLNVYRDAEKSDGGVLYDGFSDGLAYITRSARYNMAASLTIDAGAGAQLAPPFEPVDDDQRTVNQFTASRSNGSSVTLSDTTSPLSINAIGAYPQSDTFNVANDTSLPGIAGWRINLGTVYGLRYPTLAVNFISPGGSTLAAAWMTAVASTRPIGFRIDVTNVSTSATNHPLGTLLLIVEGYSITSDTKSWTVTANCVAFSPNRGLTVNSATQGRVDAANTTTNATLTTTQTGSRSMAVGSFPWTTTATFPADFPLDININGEQITVSAIAAPSGGNQAFTISVRSVNGVVMSHGTGEKVTDWQPGKVLL